MFFDLCSAGVETYKNHKDRRVFEIYITVFSFEIYSVSWRLLDVHLDCNFNVCDVEFLGIRAFINFMKARRKK